MYISASKASTGFSLLFIDTNYLNIREIFILRTHITSDIPVHIYIYILVSLRFESSRCMNILIAFDCAAINVARIRNERQNSTLSNRDDIRISRLRSAYKWPRNRYDQSMTPCQKPIPPPPPPLSFRVRNEGLTSEALPRPEREISASTCVQRVVVRMHARISKGESFESKYPKNYNIRGA